MIKANELRIGNYLYDREGRLCKVGLITTDRDSHPRGFEAPAIKGGMTALPNKPILLTEEWLLKLGFELLKGKWVKWKVDLIQDDEKTF